MRNNITALKHPTIQRKIRRALWLAKLEATKKHYNNGSSISRGTQYIANRKGHNIMRLDWNIDPSGIGSMTVWGDQSRNITNMVEAVLYSEKRG